MGLLVSDAKLAKTAATAIARVAAAIHRVANQNGSMSARDLANGCAAAMAAVRDASAHMSRKHRQHAALLANPLSTACTSINLASAATGEDRQHLLNQAQAAIALALEGVQALQNEISPIKGGSTMEGLDFLGADDGSGDSGGFVSSLFNAAGGLIKGGVQYAQGEKAKGDAATDAESKLQAAISADGTATMAVAQALMSADAASHDPSKADAALADKMMADSAVQAQDKAGAAVPAAVQPKRVDAAQKGVDSAQAKLSAALKGSSAPVKIAAKLSMQAAQQTLAKAQGGGIVKSGGALVPSDSGGGNWAVVTKKLGPLPRYAYALIAGVGYVGYRLVFKRKAS
jgi:hypothetical protein